MITRFAASFSAANIFVKNVPIGASTPSINPRPIAIPTSAEITVFDADLMLAGRRAFAPLKYCSNISSPRW